jgi:hypothetical protein
MNFKRSHCSIQCLYALLSRESYEEAIIRYRNKESETESDSISVDMLAKDSSVFIKRISSLEISEQNLDYALGTCNRAWNCFYFVSLEYDFVDILSLKAYFMNVSAECTYSES